MLDFVCLQESPYYSKYNIKIPALYVDIGRQFLLSCVDGYSSEQLHTDSYKLKTVKCHIPGEDKALIVHSHGKLMDSTIKHQSPSGTLNLKANLKLGILYLPGFYRM